MKSWLYNLARWDKSKILVNLKFVKTSYYWVLIVPIVANVLGEIENNTNIRFLGSTFSINLSLPFSWILFFFGALCFAVAYGVYTLSCPEIVQKFDTPRKFFENGFPTTELLHIITVDLRSSRSLMQEDELRNYLENLISRRTNSDTIPSQQDIYTKILRLPTIIKDIKPEMKENVFMDHVNLMRTIRKNVRLLTWLAWWGGAGCYAVVIGQNILFTIAFLVR
jgi:hypothetical protein